MPFSNYVMNLEDGSFTLYHLSTVNQVSKDSFGNLKNKKAIPFRLTRNIANFMGDLNMNGPFRVNIGVLASAIKENSDYIRNYLYLLECDNFFNPMSQDVCLLGGGLYCSRTLQPRVLPVLSRIV